MLKYVKKIFKPIKSAVLNNFDLDSGDILFLILLGLVFLGCFIALSIMLRDSRSFKPLKMLKSYLGPFMIGAIIGIIGFIPMQKGSLIWFILCFLLMLAYGRWAMHTMLKKQKWSKRESFLPELLFLITKACIVGLGFFLVFNACNSEGLHTSFAFNLFAVPIPWMFFKSIDFWSAIPEPVYKYWKYDPHAEKPSFEGMQRMRMELELAPMYVPKDAPPPFPLKQSVFMPTAVPLGTFFQRFLMDYHQQEEVSPIYDLSETNSGEAIAWIFYIFSGGDGRQKRYLDPYLSLSQNEVNMEYTTLYAERIISPPESPTGIRIISQS